MAELFDEIFNSIHLITDRKINDIQKNITIIAIISEHTNISKNLYKINYQGIEYDAYSSTNELYAIGDSVLVLIPNGNYSNKKIILMKEPKIAEDLAIGSGGHELPSGGNAGQVLTKVDNIDYNVEWTDVTTLNTTSTQSHVYVKNGSGIALTKGQAVYINGSDGTNITVGLAQANSEATSSKTLGLLEQDLANNQHGYVVTEGLLTGLNTSSATIGDPVWLSPTTPGSLIFGLVNKPTAPAHLVYLGVVSRVNANNGEIFVHVQNGFELNEVHDVSIGTKIDKDLIAYDSATGLFKNKNFTDLDIPTKTYVDGRFTSLIDGSPALLDTLNELAAAINDDANFATTITNSIATKVSKSGDTMTGTLILPSNGLQVGSNQINTSNGNVGIGAAASSSVRLSVYGSPADAVAVIRNTNTSGYGLKLWNSIDSNYSFAIQNAANTALTTTISGDGKAYFSTSVGVGVSSPSEKLEINGNIKHSGLVPTSGTNIDQIYTVTDSLTLTTSWQNTSVNSSQLATGTYIVQISSVNDNAVGGGHWTEYYSGIMSWFSGDTNSTTTDEIILHRAGHAPNAGIIYLRIKRTPTADASNLILQIAGNTNNTGASNYTFKFRRMI